MRTSEGVCFGTAGHIAQTLLVVESPGLLEKGQEVEFQLELPGLVDTIYGVAVVHFVELHDDEPNHYELRIMRLRAGDEVLLREWVDDMHQGGSSAHPHRHLRESDVSSVPSEARTASFGSPARGRGSLRAGLRRHLERAVDASPADAAEPPVELGEVEIEITEP
jgi:hypothetical protein